MSKATHRNTVLYSFIIMIAFVIVKGSASALAMLGSFSVVLAKFGKED